jgi:hypothetical protein
MTNAAGVPRIEFFVFLAAVVAVVITALTVDGDANTGGDRSTPSRRCALTILLNLDL